MSWNHRIVKHDKDGNVFYSVHEVYYEEDQPVAYTENAVPAFGETHEELMHDMINQMSALTKPVLDATMFDEKVSSSDADKYVTNTAIDILKKCSNKTSKE